jgi:hypothetical protein
MTNVLANWNYGAATPFPYGSETTYKKAIDFLDGPWVIEDWGCGTAWAKRFVKRGRYVGIDGSFSLHCDVIADLRTYRSGADGILMRHILEHNYDWKKILENALASFRRKFALIIFTPFGEVTRTIAMNENPKVPDISFWKYDILDFLRPYVFTEEALKTVTQYGQEHMFYISKDA